MYIAKESKEVQLEEEETFGTEFSEWESNLPLFASLLSRKT